MCTRHLTSIVELSDHIHTLLSTLDKIKTSLKLVHRQQCSNSHSVSPTIACSSQDRHLNAALSHIRHLLPAISAVEPELRQALSRMNERCNVVTSINHLPDEILGAIFELVPLQKYDFRAAKTVTFASVCKRWRIIALNMPTLWRSIDFHDAPSFRMANLCLARSGDIGLHVNLDLRPRGTDLLDEIRGPLLVSAAKAVMPASVRWESLTLACNDPSAATCVLSRYLMICKSHPSQSRLRTLELVSLNGALPEPAFYNALGALIDGMALTSLHFTFVQPPPTFSASYSKLAHLLLSTVRLTLRALENIMQTCVRLRCLEFTFISPPHHDPNPPVSTDPIILPDLERLAVTIASPEIILFIYSRLYAPVLRYLETGLAVPLSPGGIAIATFLHRTPTLRELKLNTNPENIVLGAMSWLPHLETLHICRGHFLRSVPSDAWPRLANIRATPSCPNDLLPIKDFIRARSETRGAPPLPAFSFEHQFNHVEEMDPHKAWLSERVHLKTWLFPKVRLRSLLFSLVNLISDLFSISLSGHHSREWRSQLFF